MKVYIIKCDWITGSSIYPNCYTTQFEAEYTIDRIKELDKEEGILEEHEINYTIIPLTLL